MIRMHVLIYRKILISNFVVSLNFAADIDKNYLANISY